jgi:6-phosphogluconolactonase
MNNMQLQQFINTEALNTAFAAQLVTILEQAIAARDAAYLVVSGGRTPQALFATLAKTPLAWEKVTILLADDRYLPPSAEQSNERLVRATLLQGYAAKANFISLYAEAVDAYAAIPAITRRIEDLPIFDAVILGMGEDGHTASLFPCCAELAAGMADNAPAVLATSPTTAPYQRITLSRVRLLQSRQLFLHLVGSSKLTVLEQAQAGTDTMQMPIRAFLQQTVVPMAVMFSPS